MANAGMKERLFNKDEKWTPEAMKLGQEVEDAIEPIIRKYIKQGYSIVDIGHILRVSGDCLILLELI